MAVSRWILSLSQIDFMKCMKQKCATCPFRRGAHELEKQNIPRVRELALSGERVPVCHEHTDVLCFGYKQFTEGSAGGGKLT